jgi:cell division protein FtsZ
MNEVDEAAKMISEAADADANIIFGAVVDENMVDQVKVVVIATGFDEARARLAGMMARATVKKKIPEGIVSEKPEEEEEPVPLGLDKAKEDGEEKDRSKEKKKQEAKSKDEFPPEDDFGEEFEIPAFLRQSK